MIEVKGDLWTMSPDETPALKLITTNGERRKDGACVMGRGCAREARDMVPGIDYKLGELLGEYGNRVFRLAAVPGEAGSHLGSFPVKHSWRDRAEPKLIRRSAHQLVELADSFGYAEIFLPRPGAGNGSLDYFSDVQPVLEEVLVSNRFRIVTF